MSDFTMPMLGAEMEAGTLVEWLKQPGDAVRRGDIIAVVDTEKGAIEIEVFEDGVIRDLVATPGTKVPVGTVLAHIDTGAGPPGAPTAAGRPVVSPAARRRAAELGVDLARIAGTGAGSAISLADVERAAVAPARKAEAPPGAEAAPEAIRRAIAAAMARSKREIPHAYLATTIDVTATMEWLAAENARRGVEDRLLPAVLLLRAAARAVADVPEINAHWIAGAARPSAAVHLGVAISLRGGGLVAPAIHDAARRSLDELMGSLRDLVGRARAGTLRSSELADATITVTNLGDQGVDTVLGVIVPPQVAIVGFGTIVMRPWVVNGQVLARQVVTCSLSFDHRVLDGHRAGLFLSAVARWLTTPEAL